MHTCPHRQTATFHCANLRPVLTATYTSIEPCLHICAACPKQPTIQACLSAGGLTGNRKLLQMGGGPGDNSSKDAQGPMPSQMGEGHSDNNSMHAEGPMPSQQGDHKGDGSNNHRGYDSHQGKGPKHPGKLAPFPLPALPTTPSLLISFSAIMPSSQGLISLTAPRSGPIAQEYGAGCTRTSCLCA